MAWTAPRTWTTSELVTASIQNTHIRDNQTFLKATQVTLGAAKAIIVGIGAVDGVTITTGVKHYIEVPFAMTLTGVTLVANAVGSIVIDIWKDVYANFPPTVADTITAAAKPTLSAANKSQDLTLTGWTTAIAAGDVLGINVDSITTCKEVVMTLRGTVP